MKVLILSSKLPYPPKDGGAIATLNLASGLALTNCELTMLCLNTKKHFFPIDDLPKDITDLFKTIAIPIDTSVKVLQTIRNFFFSSTPYIAERFYSKDFKNKLIALLQSEHFDIVQLEGPYMSIYLKYIKQFSAAKISLRAHNSEHEIWKRRIANEINPIKNIYLKNLCKRIKRMEASVISNSDMLVTISDRDAGNLVKFNPSIPCITIPAGIELEKYPSGKTIKEGSVFFIGSLDWAPNQEGIIWLLENVLPIVLKKIPGLKIHIAGRNAPEALQKRLVHKAIDFHGEVDDAIEFMSNYEIMIAPLLSGSGIRIKILEGMAMGKCVLTSTIGAEGIPIKDGENILIADTANDFAEKLLTLINDGKLRKKLSKNSRILIREKFDTFTVASRLEEFYKNSL